jgi:hypothetical protein
MKRASGARPPGATAPPGTRHPAPVPGTRNRYPAPETLPPGTRYPAPGTWHPATRYPAPGTGTRNVEPRNFPVSYLLSGPKRYSTTASSLSL